MDTYAEGISPYKLTVNLDSRGDIISLETPRPSNLHAHLRSAELMNAVARDIMVWVKYLLVMPNTGPIDTISKMVTYHNRLKEIKCEYGFEVEFIMTLYFTDQLTPRVVENLSWLPFKCAVKYYPPHKGATTESGFGIPLQDALETLQAMSEHGIRLLLHGESVYNKKGHELPHSEREGYFMQHEFPWLRESFPDLLICIEHASTKLAVDLIRSDTTGKTVATFTPHHLLFTDEDYERRSWRNHLKTMPFLKTAEDHEALVEFVTSGDKRVILGDDTAPHPSSTKVGSFDDASCGAWLPHSLSLYALVFKNAGALDERFVKFACLNGPDWWGLPRPNPTDTIRIVRETKLDVPEPTPIHGGPDGNDVVIPLGWTTEDDRLKIGHMLSKTLKC